MIRKLRLKYLFGFFRLLIYKVLYGDKVYFETLYQYLGKNTDISVVSSGKIFCGNKNYISDGATICAQNGAKIILGSNNFFNKNLYMVAYCSVKIGDNTIFGPNVIVVDHDHIFLDAHELICKQGFISKPVTIGSNVWIGGNVTICKGVTIGDRVVVGANSVVTNDLTSDGLYAGVPAKKIKNI